MGKHILVVDDSASIRQMVEHTLKGAGYQVTAANDGQAALELCERSRFDCVLTDQMDYFDTYGISTDGTELKLTYVLPSEYGGYGARTYLVHGTGTDA